MPQASRFSKPGHFCCQHQEIFLIREAGYIETLRKSDGNRTQNFTDDALNRIATAYNGQAGGEVVGGWPAFGGQDQ